MDKMATCKGLPVDDNGNPGDPLSTKSRVLETGARMVQDFTPVKQICAHLNAFHVYASDPTRCVEANHYCAHVTEGMLFPSPLSLVRVVLTKNRRQTMSALRIR